MRKLLKKSIIYSICGILAFQPAVSAAQLTNKAVYPLGEVVIINTAIPDAVGDKYSEIVKEYDEERDKISSSNSDVTSNEKELLRNLGYGDITSGGDLSGVIDSLNGGKKTTVLSQDEFEKIFSDQKDSIRQEYEKHKNDAKNNIDTEEGKKIRDDILKILSGTDPRTGKPFKSSSDDVNPNPQPHTELPVTPTPMPYDNTVVPTPAPIKDPTQDHQEPEMPELDDDISKYDLSIDKAEREINRKKSSDADNKETDIVTYKLIKDLYAALCELDPTLSFSFLTEECPADEIAGDEFYIEENGGKNPTCYKAKCHICHQEYSMTTPCACGKIIDMSVAYYNAEHSGYDLPDGSSMTDGYSWENLDKNLFGYDENGKPLAYIAAIPDDARATTVTNFWEPHDFRTRPEQKILSRDSMEDLIQFYNKDMSFANYDLQSWSIDNPNAVMSDEQVKKLFPDMSDEDIANTLIFEGHDVGNWLLDRFDKDNRTFTAPEERNFLRGKLMQDFPALYGMSDEEIKAISSNPNEQSEIRKSKITGGITKMADVLSQVYDKMPAQELSLVKINKTPEKIKNAANDLIDSADDPVKLKKKNSLYKSPLDTFTELISGVGSYEELVKDLRQYNDMLGIYTEDQMDKICGDFEKATKELTNIALSDERKKAINTIEEKWGSYEGYYNDPDNQKRIRLMANGMMIEKKGFHLDYLPLVNYTDENQVQKNLYNLDQNLSDVIREMGIDIVANGYKNENVITINSQDQEDKIIDEWESVETYINELYTAIKNKDYKNKIFDWTVNNLDYSQKEKWSDFFSGRNIFEVPPNLIYGEEFKEDTSKKNYNGFSYDPALYLERKYGKDSYELDPDTGDIIFKFGSKLNTYTDSGKFVHQWALGKEETEAFENVMGSVKNGGMQLLNYYGSTAGISLYNELMKGTLNNDLDIYFGKTRTSRRNKNEGYSSIYFQPFGEVRKLSEPKLWDDIFGTGGNGIQGGGKPSDLEDPEEEEIPEEKPESIDNEPQQVEPENPVDSSRPDDFGQQKPEIDGYEHDPGGLVDDTPTMSLTPEQRQQIQDILNNEHLNQDPPGSENLDEYNRRRQEAVDSDEFQQIVEEVFGGGSKDPRRESWTGVQEAIIPILEAKYEDSETLEQMIKDGVLASRDPKTGKERTVGDVIDAINDYLAAYTAINDDIKITLNIGTSNIDTKKLAENILVPIGTNVTITGPGGRSTFNGIQGPSISYLPPEMGTYTVNRVFNYMVMSSQIGKQTIHYSLDIQYPDGTVTKGAIVRDVQRIREDYSGIKSKKNGTETRGAVSGTFQVVKGEIQVEKQNFYDTERIQ